MEQVLIYRIYLKKNMNHGWFYLEFVRIIFNFFNKFFYDEGSEENIIRQVVANKHLQTQMVTP